MPKVDVEVSATYQSKPGALLAANYNMPAAQVAQFLGRAAVGRRGERDDEPRRRPARSTATAINQLDLRFTKVLKYGRTRTKISLDMYNALNSAPILTYNQTYNPATTDVAGADVGAGREGHEDRRVDRLLGIERALGNGLRA